MVDRKTCKVQVEGRVVEGEPTYLVVICSRESLRES